MEIYAIMSGSDYAMVPIYFNDKIVGYAPSNDGRIQRYFIIECGEGNE